MHARVIVDGLRELANFFILLNSFHGQAVGEWSDDFLYRRLKHVDRRIRTKRYFGPSMNFPTFANVSFFFASHELSHREAIKQQFFDREVERIAMARMVYNCKEFHEIHVAPCSYTFSGYVDKLEKWNISVKQRSALHQTSQPDILLTFLFH